MALQSAIFLPRTLGSYTEGLSLAPRHSGQIPLVTIRSNSSLYITSLSLESRLKKVRVNLGMMPSYRADLRHLGDGLVSLIPSLFS